MPARPAASVLAGSQPEDNAQNGPLNAYAPTSAHVTANTVETTAELLEPVALIKAKPDAASRSGIAVCQRRSLVRSDRRPHRIINTDAIPYGIALTKPISRLPRPSDLRSCGCHTDKTLPVDDAPAQTRAITRKYLF